MKGEDFGGRCSLGANVEEVGIGEGLEAVGSLLLQRENGDLFGMRDGQRAEEKAVDDAEDGGVDGHAEAEGDDRDQRESWGVAQGAHRVLKVLPEALHFYPSRRRGSRLTELRW